MEQKKPSSSNAQVVPLVVCAVLLGLGTYLAARHGNWSLLAAGGASLAVVLSGWQIGRAVDAWRAEASAARQDARATADRVEQIAVLLVVISEQQLLSDRAKSVAFREKDSEALRRAIREEMAKQNYEGAIALADDMEQAFGYKAEAEQFRSEVRDRRDEHLRKQVAESMKGVDALVRDERWTDAFREAERLAERFPTLESVKLLPREIEMRREAHKKQLMAEWHDAVKRHDPDVGIETLKRLDPYLTPAEAEAMQETVRGVFKEKLTGLRTQFSLAVQDHHWKDAVRVGEQIVRDFPNSRIATEVRETMDALKQRAGDAKAAEPARA